MTPLRVAVLGGGRSSEHEVSLASSASVAAGLREAGHDVQEIQIGRDGTWRPRNAGPSAEPIAVMPGRGLDGTDVVFPVLHGPFGEDGTVQGLLECLDVPYVGAGVLASAVCMDKVVFKELMAQAGIPQVDYRAVREQEWRDGRDAGVAGAGVARACRCSSSRHASGPRSGSSACSSADELPEALQTAFEHDPLAIVEAGAPGKEIECSVLGNDAVIASQPGEIMLAGGEAGWYDYEAKYTPGGMELIVPAGISDAARERVRELAVLAFVKSGCAGFARVDFFVDGEDVLVNELNTIPGFTQTSVFGSLFAASGIPYPELLDRLVRLAVERYERERHHRH